jgi:GntR family transcriptional regulator
VVTVNADDTLWRDIAASLRDDMEAGRLKPGDALPSELKLAADRKVSRNTVRRALAKLTTEGLITEGHGRLGRRVRRHDPLEMPFAQSESRERAAQRRDRGHDAWVTDVTEQGRTADTDLTVSIVNAEPRIARHLELPEGDPVVVRHHMRLVDGEPHNLSDTFYDPRIAEGTLIMRPRDIPQGVILYMLDELGIAQDSFLYEFEARIPTPDEQQQLRIPEGIPVIIQYTTGYEGERPVKVTVTTWPADRARLVARLPG